jgi:hypothetical protein
MDAVVRPPVRWRFSTFDPLSFVAFPDYPHDLPAHKWLKRIPLFAGRLGESVEEHLDKFLQVVSDFEVEHEDVVMRMFVSTLEGEARAWYKSLPDASIDGWDSFQGKFIERWSDKQDNIAAYEFSSIHVLSMVEQEILMTSQELQGMLAILENYDGNNASSFVTVAQRLRDFLI